MSWRFVKINSTCRFYFWSLTLKLQVRLFSKSAFTHQKKLNTGEIDVHVDLKEIVHKVPNLENGTFKLNIRLSSKSTSTSQKVFEYIWIQCPQRFWENFYMQHQCMEWYIKALYTTFLEIYLYATNRFWTRIKSMFRCLFRLKWNTLVWLIHVYE